MSGTASGGDHSVPHFLRVEEAIFPDDAVTIQIFRDEEGKPAAMVAWRPDQVDGVFLDRPPEDRLPPKDAIEIAEAAEERRGLSRIVVHLEDDDLWDPKWGVLHSDAVLQGHQH